MEECAKKPNDCGVAKTLKVIGSKWTMMIVHNIFEGNNRFGSLQRALPGISPKTLSQRLQELEAEQIITKKVFAEVPLHVEYTLTEKGKSLGDIFNSLSQWGKSTG
jgi:DNA-binding HxlR family transcriptional regulator